MRAGIPFTQPVQRDADQEPEGGIERPEDEREKHQPRRDDAHAEPLPRQQEQNRHQRQEPDDHEAVVEDLPEPEAAPGVPRRLP